MILIMADENSPSIPWVEKYRPRRFEDIVLDDINRKIFENIIKNSNFPNLLFYGPPGTGKTTTIINLIKAYQDKLNNVDSKLMIHLNASDDRGIDIIRSQISQFVNSKTLFNSGLKFVVLDEADYMTKNAQQALHNLIENMNSNVRICLICNYLSKIDMSLQGEFVHIRFNKLPEKEVGKFLETIVKNETMIDMSKTNLNLIRVTYKNDIRSMINYMQSCQKTRKTLLMDVKAYNEISNIITTNVVDSKVMNKFNLLSNKYKIDRYEILKNYLKYLLFSDSKYYVKEMFDLLALVNHCVGKSDVIIAHSVNVVRCICHKSVFNKLI